MVAISILTMFTVSFSISGAPINQTAKKVAPAAVPVIDGVLDDSIWKDGFTSFENDGSENQYKYAWDDKCLYMAFKLTDSTPCYKEDKIYKDDDDSLTYYSYEYDCVGFYFSPTNSKTTFSGNDVQFLYTLNPDGEVALRVGGGPSNQQQRLADGLYSKSVMKCERTADGWTLEVAMNWDELLAYKTASTDPDSNIKEEDKAKMFSVGLAFQDAEFASEGVPAAVNFDHVGQANWETFEGEDSLVLSNQLATCAADNFDMETRYENSNWRGYYVDQIAKYKADPASTYEIRNILTDNIDLTSATIDVKLAEGDTADLGFNNPDDGFGFDNDLLVDSIIPIGYYSLGGVFNKNNDGLNINLPMKDIEITLTLPEAVAMDRLELWGSYKEGVVEPVDYPANYETVRGYPSAYTLEVSETGDTFTTVGTYLNRDSLTKTVDNKFDFTSRQVKVIKLHITELTNSNEGDAYILMLGELAAYNLTGNVRPTDAASESESSESESSSSDSSSSESSSSISESSNSESQVPDDVTVTASISGSNSNSGTDTGNPTTADSNFNFVLAALGLVMVSGLAVAYGKRSKKNSQES